MNKGFLFLMLLGLSSFGFAQTDTVRIEAVKSKIYRCTNEDAKNWVIYTEDGSLFYLVNLTLPDSELHDWFKKFKNSQNIYRAQKTIFNQHKVFFFRKLDQLDDQIKFIVVSEKENEMTLSSEEIDQTFFFRLID